MVAALKGHIMKVHIWKDNLESSIRRCLVSSLVQSILNYLTLANNPISEHRSHVL